MQAKNRKEGWNARAGFTMGKEGCYIGREIMVSEGDRMTAIGSNTLRATTGRWGMTGI